MIFYPQTRKSLTNTLLLDVKGEIRNSTLDGRVKIEPEAKVVDSTIRGPCVIGRGALIENSFIGPYTSVGNCSQVINSNIEYCVIQENVQVKGIERLEDSLSWQKREGDKEPKEQNHQVACRRLLGDRSLTRENNNYYKYYCRN